MIRFTTFFPKVVFASMASVLVLPSAQAWAQAAAERSTTASTPTLTTATTALSPSTSSLTSSSDSSSSDSSSSNLAAADLTARQSPSADEAELSKPEKTNYAFAPVIAYNPDYGVIAGAAVFAYPTHHQDYYFHHCH